mmetsp:Transcript_143524/g.202938  ORF Transcript_143524/g.202938 Transcript_143524/m.202938 type:complete len:112 (-) Transcript_143524:257-592(-)
MAEFLESLQVEEEPQQFWREEEEVVEDEGDDDDGDDDGDDEEDDGPKDPTPMYRDRCRQTTCKGVVETYDACARRLALWEKEAEKNCSHQFMEMWRCVDRCAVPQVFATLK